MHGHRGHGGGFGFVVALLGVGIFSALISLVIEAIAALTEPRRERLFSMTQLSDVEFREWMVRTKRDPGSGQPYLRSLGYNP